VKKPAFPKSVRVAGHDYTVRLANPDGDLETVNVGRCDHYRMRITLDASMSPDAQRSTLLHELIHAADKRFGASDMTEAQVLALENGLWAIFRDNAGLASAIFGR